MGTTIYVHESGGHYWQPDEIVKGADILGSLAAGEGEMGMEGFVARDAQGGEGGGEIVGQASERIGFHPGPEHVGAFGRGEGAQTGRSHFERGMAGAD